MRTILFWHPIWGRLGGETALRDGVNSIALRQPVYGTLTLRQPVYGTLTLRQPVYGTLTVREGT